MKINELDNLWCATNTDTEEDFTILVVAFDKIEAKEIAIGYFHDSSIDTDPDNIKIEEFTDINTHFDCDYVVG